MGIEVRFAYELLGLDFNSPPNVIKKAYRLLALEKHPDKCPNDPEANKKFVQIQKAYECLLNFQKGAKLKVNSNYTSENTPTHQPPPNEFPLILTLEEIFLGCTKHKKIFRKVTDRNGLDKIEAFTTIVEVKCGTLAGARITLTQQGDRICGKIPANVVFIVQEEQHRLFRRNKFDLQYIATITSKEAILGVKKLCIPTLDKEPLFLTVNGLITKDTVHRVTNRGLFYDSHKKRGDLIVKFDIAFDSEYQEPPIEHELFLTLQQILKGCIKNIKITRKIINKNGNKKFEDKVFNIKVNPGTEVETRFPFPQQGDRRPGTIPADIIFIIRDAPNEVFRRNGVDIEYTAKIKRKQLCIGDQIDIPTLDGEKLSFSLDDINNPKTGKHFPGQGLPYLTDINRRGNLIVKFEIIDPFTDVFQDPPIEHDLFLTLENILNGCKKRLNINRTIVDSDGNETSKDEIVTINVPPGTEAGTLFRFPRLGDHHAGTIPSDIIFIASDKPNYTFVRNGIDIEYNVKITMYEARNGCQIQIPTLEKEFFPLKVYKGIEDKSVEVISDDQIEHFINATLEEILYGCAKQSTYNRKVIDFNGKELEETKVFNIEIKPGIQDGTQFCFYREGSQQKDRIPADIIYTVRQSPIDLYFKRNGNDLECLVPISKRELVTRQLTVMTFQHHLLKIKLDKSDLRKMFIRISAHGMPYFVDGLMMRGDLVVHLKPYCFICLALFAHNDASSTMVQLTLKESLQTLGFHLRAPLTEIKKSYRKLSLKYHPDKSKEPDAQKKFLEIKKAYEYLDDFYKKENLDNKIDTENSGDPRNESQPEQQPPPNEMQVSLTLEQLFAGCTKEVTFTRKIIDEHGTESEEQKTLILEIKAGTLTGKRITKASEGDRHYGKIPANVVFIVTELPHPIFRRVNQIKLEYTAEITLEQAFMAKKEGLTIDVPTIDGSPLQWHIDRKETITDSTIESIPGQGFPKQDSNVLRGDLEVKFKINYEFKHIPKEEPIVHDLLLTLEQIVRGCKRRIQINPIIVDSEGNETLEEKIVTVEIKPGTAIGTEITFPKCGDQSPGKIAGDVIFVIGAKPHSKFERNGNDIELKAILTSEDFNMDCNSQLIIPTLQDKPIMFALNELQEPFQKSSFDGLGLPCSDGTRGKLVVRFTIRQSAEDQIKKFLCLTNEELEQGCIKDILVNRIENDETKKAKLKIEIPLKTIIDTDTETRYIILSEGNQGSISNNVVIIILPKKGFPVEHELKLSLEQILMGHEKKVQIIRQIIDSDGTETEEGKVIDIKVKPGTETGTRIVFEEYGDKYPDSYSADIIFVVSDKPHEHFKRKNAVDIEYIVQLTQSDLLNRDELTIPTLEMDTLKLNVDETIQNGDCRRFSNRGLPFVNEPEKRGDLIVCFKIN